MIFQYPKAAKVIEVLSDLIKIHNDRMVSYQHALDQTATTLDAAVYEAFGKIIADTKHYKAQLAHKIKELNGDPAKGILGKIYNAWTALKVTLPGSTQKSIISSCMYNEEIAQYAYKAALSANESISMEIRQLIESQEDALKDTYRIINKYRDAPQAINYKMAYFS